MTGDTGQTYETIVDLASFRIEGERRMDGEGDVDGNTNIAKLKCARNG